MLSANVSLSSAGFETSPFFTTAVDVTVTKKVQISITSSSRMSLTVSRIPARTGEIRYLALPARLTRPLAFEYSSRVKRSVTVAR